MAEPVRPLPTALMMPGHVRGGQVISLVEITGSMGGKIDIPKLADEMGADVAVLLPILDAAEMLGLVRVEKGDVRLTDLGLRFQKTTRDKLTMLKDRIATIEPFRTTLEMVRKGKSVTSSEVAETLGEMGLRWHYQPEINESVIQTLLIHWSIYAELLRYNGKTGKFQRV